MDRLLYVAMSGAKEAMRGQAVNANNLANANTTGFRADLQSFRTVNVDGPGYNARAYAVDAGAGVSSNPGSLVTTGRALDVAVDGDGWIAVQAPDGSQAYTRAGNLRVDSNGLMTTGNGLPVIGDAGPVAVPPYSHIQVGGDGTVSVVPLGQKATTLASVGRVKLVSAAPGTLTKGADGLMHTADNTPLLADAKVGLASGTLESSNVNSVASMVNMIDLARQYEVQVKLMKTAQDDDRAAAQLLQVS